MCGRAIRDHRYLEREGGREGGEALEMILLGNSPENPSTKLFIFFLLFSASLAGSKLVTGVMLRWAVWY